MAIPSDLRYTTDHLWARLEGSLVRIGITDFAQEALGDIIFVELPTVGDSVERDGILGEVESTKSVSELYAPVSGVILEINENLANSPSKLNSDPYLDGWVCVIDPKESGEFAALLDAPGYAELTSA